MNMILTLNISSFESVVTRKQSNEMIIAVIVTSICGGIIYIGGFFGNILSFSIFVQKNVRNLSTGLLFLILTILNTIHLYTLVIDYFHLVYDIKFYKLVFLHCRFELWIQNVSRTMSSYIAVTICIDRMIRSEPRPSLSKQHIYKLTIIYFILFGLMFSFYFCPLNKENQYGNCYADLKSSYHLFISEIWTPIRIVIVGVIPIVIMIITNIRIFYNMRKSKRRVHHSNQIIHSGKSGTLSTKIDSMMVVIMISNVLTFFVTQVPFHIVALVNAYGTHYFPTYFSRRMNYILRALVLMLSSLYFGIGFYLYWISSPLFRKKFTNTIKIIIRKTFSINTWIVRKNQMFGINRHNDVK
ncbi:unnamed protein product [Didymodactylos carnosus]|uniref:G-protein coupled receptors family 1 profile domain-containing protein n=1 Tax=Didymodactylos carnosus TaxID=1234261 RepID=A0A813PNB6_9BILA|nr:unnamed protein product [Didymodactylos carnosus]CAF3536224.1 unnamed protein product [Didymodactylos carnosus]